MDQKEAIEQLKSLIEHFENGGRDIEDKDIDSIKFLLEEIKQLYKRDTYTNIVHNQFQTEKKGRRYYENILDELEKWLEEEIKEWNDLESMMISGRVVYYEEVLEKLKKLKGSDK